MKLNVWRIKLLLAEKGLNQTDLAAITGVSRQQISRLFKQEGCYLKTVGKIAKGLGVNVSEILVEG